MSDNSQSGGLLQALGQAGVLVLLVAIAMVVRSYIVIAILNAVLSMRLYESPQRSISQLTNN
ncbi:hypothetical protein IQ259_11965 [Fortiea sp. LEGE XX443]|uniref:hypothetical protein n=1 Tax=Fortiea sp. LEGE XX443 TaxID=1828611 RepID=UPI00187FFC61|nr:hypothetical protein [Fortiea sp. LEGE XX443]MBE9005742.1 hypothetical protein [Fortiea sp. LEGE XX443]